MKSLMQIGDTILQFIPVKNMKQHIAARKDHGEKNDNHPSPQKKNKKNKQQTNKRIRWQHNNRILALYPGL